MGLLSIKTKTKLARKFMKLTSPESMKEVDDPSVVGKLVTWQTTKGPVQQLLYGFDTDEVRPLVVNIHGSGFTLGSAAMDDAFMNQFVEECGCKVVSIDYALAPESMFPVALEQCYATVLYAQQHADELKIDPNRIALMGHSAGGNFCAGIGILNGRRKELDIKGLVLDYPPCDVATDAFDKPLPKGCIPPQMARIFDAAYRKPEDAKNPLISPIFATEEEISSFPRTLVITAEQDSLAGEAQTFAEHLKTAGVSVQTRHIEGVPHAFTHKLADPAFHDSAAAAWALMKSFMNEVLA